jgi:hypothetical protein
VIYEHGKSWWNYIDREILFAHQSFLAIVPAESSSRKTGGTGKVKYWISPYEVVPPS